MSAILIVLDFNYNSKIVNWIRQSIFKIVRRAFRTSFSLFQVRYSAENRDQNYADVDWKIDVPIAKSDHVCGLWIIRLYDNSVVCSRRYEMCERITAQNVKEKKLNYSKIAQRFHARIERGFLRDNLDIDCLDYYLLDTANRWHQHRLALIKRLTLPL